jgi:hypothetical protein
VPANRRRGRPQGQCHRKQTARASTVRPQGLTRRSAGKGETVRQERTAPLATGAAGQTPPGARPNRGGRRHGTKTHFAPWPRRRSRLVARVGRVRRAARRVPEEWSSRVAQGTFNEAIWTARTEPGLQAVWRYISTGRSIVTHKAALELPTTLPTTLPTRTKQKHQYLHERIAADRTTSNRRQLVDMRLKFRSRRQVTTCDSF